MIETHMPKKKKYPNFMIMYKKKRSRKDLDKKKKDAVVNVVTEADEGGRTHEGVENGKVTGHTIMEGCRVQSATRAPGSGSAGDGYIQSSVPPGCDAFPCFSPFIRNSSIAKLIGHTCAIRVENRLDSRKGGSSHPELKVPNKKEADTKGSPGHISNDTYSVLKRPKPVDNNKKGHRIIS